MAKSKSKPMRFKSLYPAMKEVRRRMKEAKEEKENDK